MTRFLPLGLLVLLVGCQQAVIDTPETSLESDNTAQVEQTSSVAVLELDEGMCLNDIDQPLAQDLTEVPTVPCEEPHESEVFAEITIPDGDFPGIDAVQAQAVEACQVEFRRFVGVEFTASTLNFHYYYPTESSWYVGDRSIYCVVFDPGQLTEGTLRGANR